MFKKTALIIDNKNNYSKFEIFKFYYLKSLNLNIKEFIIEDTIFYIISVPIPEKVKVKNVKYLAQYINSITDKYHSREVYYCWDGNNKKILYKYFNNKKNTISYARIYPLDYIIKKYAAFLNITPSLSDLILICDFPLDAENIIRQVCRDVRSIHIYSKNKELYKPLTDYFLSEYGIFISVSKNVTGVSEKNKIIVNLSDNEAFIKEFTEKNEIMALNLTDKNINIKSLYNNIIFSSDVRLKNIIYCLGLFDKNVLNFIFNSLYTEKNKSEFMRFIHKFDIKIINFVKND